MAGFALFSYKKKKKKDRVLTNPYSSNEFVTFACS